MTQDNFTITCEDIRKELKPFLEDLLKEEKYQAFFEHLGQCSACKEYVRSIDAFSNQLWKLADVKVPSDFCATVLFKLKQSEQAPPKSSFVLSKKILVGGFIVILAAAVLFFGIGYFKLRKSPPVEEEVVPPPVVTVETKQRSVDDQQAKVLFSQLKAIAEGLGVSREQGNAEEVPATEEVSGEEESEVSAPVAGQSSDFQNTSSEDEPAAPVPVLLHWHFLRSDKMKEVELLRLKREKRNMEAKLRQGMKEKEQIEAEIEYLKKEKKDIEFELLPVGAIEKGKLEQEKTQVAFELQQRYELLKQKDKTIAGLEKEISRTVSKLEEDLQDTNRRKNEPQNILNTLGISLDYQDDDFLLFAVAKDELKNVRERIARISPENPPVQDFTPATSDVSNEEYHVSVYIEKENATARHWHVSLVLADQRLQLLKMIREQGGSINYEFKEEVIFSIPNLKVEMLKTQMAAMRIGLSEFGYRGDEENTLVSTMETISIYFSP